MSEIDDSKEKQDYEYWKLYYDNLGNKWQVPQPYMHFAAGTCGKCGAPYTLSPTTGQPQPICCCWNLPQIKTTTGSNT